jgi:subtilisin family serine protease
MLKRARITTSLLVSLSLLILVDTLACRPAAQKKVTSQADLPRFTYPMTMLASELVQADKAAFDPFATKVRTDVESVLREYDISDKAALRDLLSAKLALQQFAGDYQSALETLKARRGLEDKPAARLTFGLALESELTAAIVAKSTSGGAFEQAFAKSYGDAIDALPWDLVQDPVKVGWAYAKLNTAASLIAIVKSDLDPAVNTSHALTNNQAWQLLTFRRALLFDVPLKDARAAILGKYVKAHHVVKPDIWAARDVILTPQDHLTPVLVGIWDSGVDISIFRDNLFTDPHPTASGPHGLAFLDDGAPSQSWLYPLTRAQQAEYPTFRDELKGTIDLENAIESPEAEQLLDRMSTYTPEQLAERRELQKWISFYVHGTHVAGIASRGNPAVRLVVARFNDQLHDLTFPPTPEWARRLSADFQQMSEYFRTRNVRVVNMSWADDPQEFELWLSNTGGPTDPQERKKRASELYSIWHDAIETAINNAPNTLFLCAAGNANSDASFMQSVPAGLRLPNLVSVGAVNQAGDETAFTSYGPTVLVHANGYEVESYIPGAAKVKSSGTSMASPNVANLAAKLFALDPSLTPVEAIDLIKRGATPSEDGRRHLLDPKRSIELLRIRTSAPAASTR